MTTALYITVMAGVTYLIRMLPMAVFRKKITSKYVRSFLYYIPYTVLAAMTVPAIFYSTGSLATAVIGTAAALVMSFFELPLIAVALGASAAALAAGFIF